MRTGDIIGAYRVHVVHDLPQAGFQIVETTIGEAGRSIYALLLDNDLPCGRSYKTTTFRRSEGHYGVRVWNYNGFSYYTQSYVTTLEEAMLVLRGAAILLETLNDPQ